MKEAADLTVYYCERVQHNSYNTLTLPWSQVIRVRERELSRQN